jgi:hypothetical protein
MNRIFANSLVSALLLTLAACGGGGGGGGTTTTPPPPPAATAPAITTQPAAASAAIGTTATFTVVASGTAPLSYQWQKNGAAISGATAASYTTPAVVAGDNGASFVVVVTNSAGSATSNAAKLTVPAPGATVPTITTQPTNETAPVGTTATFAVVAAGTAPLTYQWQKVTAGVAAPIASATAASYTTPPTANTDNGTKFNVVVSNSAGNVTSSTITLTVGPLGGVGGPSGPDVLTYKYDTSRTGANIAETILTTATVNTATFGLLRTLAADGKVDAQPLYVASVPIAGALHNTVYVATEHGSVYAYDADVAGNPLWKVSLVGAGETTSDDMGCDEITPEIGITSTPAIDKNAGPHGTIYVVAMTKTVSGGAFHQRLHALDLTTGAEQFGGATEITATFTNAQGTTTFDPKQYEERAALLLANGLIYTTYSSHCDTGPYGGWIIAFDRTTLKSTPGTILNLGPGTATSGFTNANTGPGIWMSGSGPVVDAQGNVYLSTGNGPHETMEDANGLPILGDYGNSVVRLSYTAANGSTPAAIGVNDYFFPDNGNTESGFDIEIGSGGVVLLPPLIDAGAVTRNLVVAAGKDGDIYVIDKDDMGEWNQTHNNIFQDVVGALGTGSTSPAANFQGGIWGSPAYFDGSLYYGQKKGTLKSFGVFNAKVVTPFHNQTAATFQYPGVNPVVSANTNLEGIAWASEQVPAAGAGLPTTAVLHAFNATALGTELYSSTQNAADTLGNAVTFATPVVTGGQVFVGTTTGVAVFGIRH